MNSPDARPVIAVTPGDPAGIGPDVLLKYIANEMHSGSPALLAIADAGLLRERAKQLGLAVSIKELTQAGPDTLAQQPGEINVLGAPGYQHCKPGQPVAGNARYLLHSLDRAVQLCMEHTVDALVTGPLNKHLINQGLAVDNASQPGFFSGHTEYLAKITNTPRVVMMLAGQPENHALPQLRVALATTHLPLADVAKAINAEDLTETLRILYRELIDRFGIAEPKIRVCGLNPHAGEQGDLGREELEIINPVIHSLQQQGLAIDEALPADTLFTAKYLADTDAVLAMYHDQGLPVLKSHCFGRAANITLGLPIIRSSVDHGTAYDLAGSGEADGGSFATAIEFAAQMASARSNREAAAHS